MCWPKRTQGPLQSAVGEGGHLNVAVRINYVKKPYPLLALKLTQSHLELTQDSVHFPPVPTSSPLHPFVSTIQFPELREEGMVSCVHTPIPSHHSCSQRL